MTTIADALAWASSRLQDVSSNPRLEAEVLLAHSLAVSRTHLYTWPEQALSDQSRTAMLTLVEQRRQGIPIAYLTGLQEFWSLPLTVSSDTLIPRSETELIVEEALARIPAAQAQAVLDLGTGSGAIALAIASERPLATVCAVDISPGALQIAALNASQLKLKVQFLESDWFAALHGQRFNLIAANPPYIGEDEPELKVSDLRYEPRQALIAKESGLAALKHIIMNAPAHLEHDGWLLVEHGYQQGAACRDIFKQAGFTQVATRQDLQGHDRVTLAQISHRQTP